MPINTSFNRKLVLIRQHNVPIIADALILLSFEAEIRVGR